MKRPAAAKPKPASKKKARSAEEKPDEEKPDEVPAASSVLDLTPETPPRKVDQKREKTPPTKETLTEVPYDDDDDQESWQWAIEILGPRQT